MMSKVVLLLLLATAAVNAQKFEMGKVSIAELQETAHPKDPSAAAAVLFEKGTVRFNFSQDNGFDMVLEVKTRIKIYSKQGYEWANKQVPYYTSGSDNEKVVFNDVATYNLVDGKIEKTKMKSDGEFGERINRYWSNKKIALPNVREGSVIEYSYQVQSPTIGKFRDWNFQNSIPVNYSEFVTYVPEYFVYNANQRGYIFPKVTTERMQKSVSYNYREKSVPGGSIVHATSQEKLEFVETKTAYIAENMPALKDEAFVNNIKNYTSGISHELSMVKAPNVPFKSYSTNWETVVKEIYKYDDFGPELDKTGYFENDVTALLSGVTDTRDIIAKVYGHAKSAVKWNGYYSYGCNDGVKSAYKNKTGNVAEVNLMLTAMLRFAGLKANPVLISTRSNGISYFPNRTAFNYVIAAVETPDGLILLDATDQFALPNILPLRDLNWFGRLIRKDGTSIEVDLTPKNMSKEINYLNIVMNGDGTAEGKVRKQYTDYEAFEYRNKTVATIKEAYVESLENQHDAIEISEYVRDNDLDLGKPVVESFSFKDSKHIEVINGKIYMSPLLFLNVTENPFKQDKREYPVDFGYPSEQRYNINIEIPAGYAVESLPQAINLVTGDDIGGFKYAIVATDNRIQVSITSSINTAIISAEYYEVIKDFYQKMIAKQSEKIILVKS